MIINAIQAQEDDKSRFTLNLSGGIGYGHVENNNEPNYNLNSNSADLLLNYRIGQKFGIGTGIGMYELTGNGFNSLGNFSHERKVIKIPLVATYNKNISDKFEFLANLGVFTQGIINDEYRFLNSSQKDVYEGWNFGAQFGFGFAFKMSESFSIGLTYSEHFEFNKFKSNSNTGINDNQRVDNRNTIGLLFIIK